jgi:phage terminase large subunit
MGVVPEQTPRHSARRPPMPLDIEIPSKGWEPRPHQARLWAHLQGGGKRAMAVWHRRAGKEEICLHHAAVSMM